MIMLIPSRSLLAAALIASTLAGCSRTPDAPEAAVAPGTAAAADTRIGPADARTAIQQVGAIHYDPATDTVRMRINVTNYGKVALPAEGGQNPVRVGVVLLGPDGTSDAPGTRDFARLHLAEPLQPGVSVELETEFPAAPVVGLTVQYELLQEGVAWFTYDYRQPPLTIGPFERCEGNERSLCVDGKAIGSAASAPAPAG